MSHLVSRAYANDNLDELLPSLSTLSFQDSFHLCIAFYLSGRLEEAERCLSHCISLDNNSLGSSIALSHPTDRQLLSNC